MRITVMRVSLAVVAFGLMVCAVAAVRPDLFGAKEKTPDTSVLTMIEEDPISKFRREREQLRSIQLEELDDMIDDQETSPDMRELACKEKIEILRRYENEQTVEGIIEARGFGRCAVSDDGACVTIVIENSNELQENMSAITELVVSQTGAGVGDIKIIPIN